MAITRFLLVFAILIMPFFSDETHGKSDKNEAGKNKKPSTKEAPTRIRSDIIDIKRKSQTIDFLGNVVVEKEDSSLLAKKMTVLYEEKSTEDLAVKAKKDKLVKERLAKEKACEDEAYKGELSKDKLPKDMSSKAKLSREQIAKVKACKDELVKEEEAKEKVAKENEEKAEEKPKTETSIKRIDAKDDVKIFSEEFIATGSTGYYDPNENIFVLETNVMVNNGTSIANGDKFVYHLDTKKGNFVGKSSESLVAGEEPTDKRVVVVIGDDLQTQKSSNKSNKNKK